MQAVAEAEYPLHPLLQFLDKTHKKRCASLISLPIHPSYHIMLSDLATIGLDESVRDD